MSTEIPNPVTATFSPGFGKKRQKYAPRGRQVTAEALADISALLHDHDLSRRDLLIEHLHVIQDYYGHLSAPHIAALAQLMGLAQTEVYEVATFYAHFDVVKEGETPPPTTTIRVCDSISCMMAGAEQLISQLSSQLDHPESQVRVVRAPCMGRCDHAPVAEVGHYFVDDATTESVCTAVAQGRTKPIIPDYQTLTQYQAEGGYQFLTRCLSGEQSIESMISILHDANLRGLGGAGFPTGKKWQFVRSYEGPRLMAVNGDEGEPGTFKDRYYLERKPHHFLEGMLIAAWAVEAETIYIYLRDEYPTAREILLNELAALAKAGLTDHVNIELRRGAGAYICGEESAMIESIEGKRGLPRHRPPYVAEVGIFGRPTLVHNIETLYWLPDIFNKGAGWFTQEHNPEIDDGTSLRSYSVSGRVKSPGVKLAPAGITVQALIDEYCDGMTEGHRFVAYLPGGASGGILPASKGDLPLEFGALSEVGAFVGSHAVVIISDQDDLRAVALNLLKFFEDESCGQCTPCRVGTQKLVTLMSKPDWDTDTLSELAEVMQNASICGLGQAAPNPLLSLIRFFPEALKPDYAAKAATTHTGESA